MNQENRNPENNEAAQENRSSGALASLGNEDRPAQSSESINSTPALPHVSPLVIAFFGDCREATTGPNQGVTVILLRKSRIDKFERNPVVGVTRFNKVTKQLEHGDLDYRSLIAEARDVYAKVNAK